METKFNETFLLAFDILCAWYAYIIILYVMNRWGQKWQHNAHTYVTYKKRMLSEKGMRRLAKKKNAICRF